MTESELATISSWVETLETNQDEAIESADEIIDYLRPEYETVVRKQAAEALGLTTSPYGEGEEVAGKIAQLHEDKILGVLKHRLSQEYSAIVLFELLRYNPDGEYQDFIANYADPILNKGFNGEVGIWTRLGFLVDICQENPEKYNPLIKPLFQWTLWGYREGKMALKALNQLANEHPEEFVEAVDNSEDRDELLSRNEWADRYSLEQDFIDIYRESRQSASGLDPEGN